VIQQEYILLLESHLAEKESHLAEKESQLAEKESQLKEREDTIALLKKEVEHLLSMLEKQGVKKGSHNSHLPPSKDLFVKNKSLRVPSTRKTGGQLGHQGHTLEMNAHPEVTVYLRDDRCAKCGNGLEDAIFVLKAKRQVVDIPSIPPPVYTEYRQYSCTCPNCDHKQVADFPAGVNSPIQYGSRIKAAISYFSVFQHMPYDRMTSMFSQLFGLNLSEGSIKNILKKAADKVQGLYEQIKLELSKSPVVGSDETSIHVNGKNHWIWVWQNTFNTFIVASDNRGFRTIDSVWENGLPNATLVSDRLAAQLKMSSGNNQICLAHLLRELAYLKEAEKHPFAQGFIALLKEVFQFKKILIERNSPCSDQEGSLFKNKLDKLLEILISKEEYPETATFHKSMLKNQDFILPCLYNLEVPPDNNASERAIRNIKVKQKVSGQFKSGQQVFCVLRSVMDTFIKRDLNVFNSLILSMDGNFSF
jgi:transposase